MGRKISVEAVIDWVRMRLGLVPSTPAATYGQFYLKADGTHATRLPNGTDWVAAVSTHTHGGSLPSFVVGDAGKFLNVNGTGTATEWDLLTNADLPNSGVSAGTYSPANVTVNAKGIITAASTNSDVALNTAARHNPVTVTDSSEIDFTLTGQDVTASLKTTGVAAASYTFPNITIDSKGRITSATSNTTATPTDNLDYRGRRAVINVNGSRTLQLTDRNALLLCNAVGAVTLTVPTNASVAFAVNDEIDVVRYMANGVTFAASVGVTINHAGGLSILTAYRAAWLKKIATDEWLLLGDI